ncbi:hypothetical protein LCI18_003764 [Fusarium solani-melongenae]|uniref:Uncharacterized protein n=1 Tax=Fusarium solani subsp. cucurbitae TaxID=2747967 RepID=A0ACD3YV43_FUSSC|nr:hypothetical protein LCI18_003764 [Fusarium solani-melongenae]
MPSNINATSPHLEAALQAVLDRGETGVSVAAYYRGKIIAHGTAGYADVSKKFPVDEKTLFPVFSVTKGITALAAHIQTDRGLLNLQDHVSKYWPEFAANGKDNITVEDALSHRAGTENAYHVLIWGWIVGEVVRRTDPKSRPFGQFVAEEICEPLGVKDLYLGVPDFGLSRVATLSGGNEMFLEDTYNTSPIAVFPGSDVHNLKVVQQACDPDAGAIGNAPAIARVFAMVAEGGELDGVRLLSENYVRGMTRFRQNPYDQDKVLPIPVWFGAAGFWLGGEKGASDLLVGDHRDVIYSPGAGGSIAWADMRDRIAASICHNNMDAGVSIDPEPIWTPIGKAIRVIIKEKQE